MDPQNVSFKVVLHSQIRRFVLAQDVSTSFKYLMEKLSNMFMELHHKDFRCVFLKVKERESEWERKKEKERYKEKDREREKKQERERKR